MQKVFPSFLDSAGWRMLMIAFLIGLASVPAHATEEEYLGGLPLVEGPLKVNIGFNLVNITNISEREETIEFEGALYLNWMDPRLAYDPEEVGLDNLASLDYTHTPRRIYQGDFAVKEIFEGWRLHMVMPNGIGDRVTTNMAVSIWPNGRVEYTETFYAMAETPMQLRRFPFDVQHLEIFFHPFVYLRDEVVLVPDDNLVRTWQQNLGIAEWVQGAMVLEERPANIAYFDDSRETVSELMVTIEITRRPWHVLASIIFPMILLVSLTWSVFWMDEESVSDRINITFIGILSVVAYYLVIQDNIPRIDYLTLIDGFIITTFLVLSAGVVLTVVMERLRQSGRPQEVGRKVDRVSRWAFPLGYFSISTIVCLVFFNLS